MAKKPTYEGLEQRCKKLEKEVLERQRAEEMVRDPEAKYRDLFENAPIGMFQSTVEGKALNVNKAYAQIFGYESPADVIASVTDTAKQVDVQPELWKKLVDMILKQNRLLNFENHYVRRDGTVFIGNLHLRVARNNDGSIRYLEGFVEDITERKRAKDSLEQSNIAMLDMVESIGDGFFSLDDRFVVTYFNRAAERLLGRKSWEVLGHDFFEAFPEIKGSIFEDKFTAGVNEKIFLSFETYFDVKPYENWYEVRVYPQKNGITVYFQVTTERKRAEEEKKRLEAQLQQAQKMKAIGALAGGIANDFNNLLSVIEGNASLMLFNIDATHPHYENLKSIEKQAQGGSKLSAQLLGYAGKGRYEVKPLNLNQLLEETSEAFGRTRKETTIHRELADDLFAIKADRGQIEQVLSNLYVNAAHAMPGGGDLLLKTRNVTHKDMEGKLYDPKPGNYVMLTVADTGAGMDEKTMERIFEPFFTTRETGGATGLGLSSAYGIIEGHGGYIDVDSSKGHGTTFTICLRALEKKVEKTVAKEKKVPEEILKGTETVLVVDDEEMILEVGEEMLRAMGYKVLLAKGGREAVEIYKANKNDIDLVILDMIMPDMAGGEVYDTMKEINPNIKVLLSTGYSIEGQASEILDRGCDGFIQKPFGVKELSGKIREILDQ
jgi:two-component system cell cycle sensor histidine kinase/response regulator CckA